MKSMLLPESQYELKDLTWNDVVDAFKQETTLTGFVEKIDEEKRELYVALGENLYGYLPFDEATIYQLHHTANTNYTLPVEIRTLLHKKVRVKVTEASPSEDYILLSRKANMKKAFEYLKQCSVFLTEISNITSSMAFCDVGDGIIACIYICDVAKARLRNISDYLHQGDIVWTALLSIDEENKRFVLSYKNSFPEYNPSNFTPGDAIIGRVCEPVDKRETGYFIDISPQVSGIMDTSSWTPLLRYGDKVECYILKATDKGLKLSFLKKIV